MECNKEEAMRAKDIAERKMQSRDFSGARKIVLKAQQLFPDLENISQMLTVCDVHCSAAMKVNGSENWYGILQVEQTADESSIKKQYRKLALLLHPDKNKFAGAEAAFKLIGEANRTLSDHAKRSLYDLKIRSSFRTVMPKQQPQQPNRNFPANHANMQFTGLNQQSRGQYQQAQAGAQTFWTQCPFCEMKYQYYRTVLNKALRCQSCQQPFVAHEISLQSVPEGVGSNWNKSSIPQQHKFPGQGIHNAGGPNNVFQGNVSGSPESVSKREMDVELGGGLTSKGKGENKADKEAGKVHEVKFEKVKLGTSKEKGQAVKSKATSSGKRGRKMVIESSESESTGESESTDSEEVIIEGADHSVRQNSGTTNNRYPRRSARLKQNVTYKENGSDDEIFGSTRKRLRKSGTSHDTDQGDPEFLGGDANEGQIPASENAKKDDRSNASTLEENLPKRDEQGEKSKGNLEENLPNGASSKKNPTVTTQNTKDFSYPDPEFCDFEKDKVAGKFEAGQIWALYDDLDGMPRFYALIRCVSSPEFMLRYTWLENDPVSKDEKEWVVEDLPLACGNFKLGRSQKTQDLPIFSHVISIRQSLRRNMFEIYPRAGEVWAIFKGWDINWSSDPDNHRQYEYEIVEVLTDYAYDVGVRVVHLVRLRGFVSLFCRGLNEGDAPVQIQPNKILMFSHMVPAHRLTGEEREGVPEGSYELDAAALPANFQESFPSVDLDEIYMRAEEADVKHHGQRSEFVTGEKKPANEGVTSSTLNKRNELNENIPNELHVRSRNYAKGVNGAQDRSRTESGTSHSATADVEKNAGVKRMGQECQVDKVGEVAGSPDSTSSSYAEYHHDSPPVFEYPDSEFYCFESERSLQSFQTGQIWALYCDLDSFPKYYAVINKVSLAKFKVHVTWLEACPELEEEIRWSEEDLPISCGRFKVQSGRKSTQVYDTVETFSHPVRAEATELKQRYDIYPRVGEVWALYKSWSVGWKSSNLVDCEYDLVEVLANADSRIEVIVLTKLDGFKAVFRPERKAGTENTKVITRKELLRFSHQIPAFRLTEERGGKLRGCWELDTASVPEVFLCTGT